MPRDMISVHSPNTSGQIRLVNPWEEGESVTFTCLRAGAVERERLLSSRSREKTSPLARGSALASPSRAIFPPERG